MLNVPNIVADELIANVEGQATTEIIKETREEVEWAVSKLKNGKAPASNDIVLGFGEEWRSEIA